MKRPRRTRSSSPSLPEQRLRSSEFDDERSASLENQTNFNWQDGNQKKRRKKEEKPEPSIRIAQNNQVCQEIVANSFLESSHFFIDQLKDEYFTKVDGGWLELKYSCEEMVPPKPKKRKGSAPPRQPELRNVPTISAPGGLRQGTWTQDEHQLFLEGLRRYGKDWSRIEILVGTRDVKSIVSHGQKFLMRLIRFLDEKESIDEMTLEEAEYFHGVLKQRMHHFTKQKEIKDDLKAKGHYFKIDHVKHTTPAQQPIPPTYQIELSEDHHAYKKWKEEVAGTEAQSFHLSLGRSIKIQKSLAGDTGRQSSKFRFKTKVNVKDIFNEDSDSAESMGRKHNRRFAVDDRLSFLWRHEGLTRELMEKIVDAFSNLPDLEDDEEFPSDIVMKINGKEIPILSKATGENVLQFASNSIMRAFLQKTHPKFNEKAKKKIKDLMYEEEDFLKSEELHPLIEYLSGLSRAKMEEVLQQEITFSYQTDTQK